MGRKGLKAELTTRLKQAMIEKVPIQNTLELDAANTSILTEGACWKVLNPVAEEVIYPNTNAQFRSPTTGEEELTNMK